MRDDGPNYCVCCQLDCSCQDLPDEMFEDFLHRLSRNWPVIKSMPMFPSILAEDLVDVQVMASSYEIPLLDIDLDWDPDEVTQPMFELDTDEGFFSEAERLNKEISEKWKKDGLCLVCGDRGEFISGACFCRNGHGKIFG